MGVGEFTSWTTACLALRLCGCGGHTSYHSSYLGICLLDLSSMSTGLIPMDWLKVSLTMRSRERGREAMIPRVLFCTSSAHFCLVSCFTDGCAMEQVVALWKSHDAQGNERYERAIQMQCVEVSGEGVLTGRRSC